MTATTVTGACPAPEDILDYVQGTADAARRREVHIHIASCDRCREWVGGLAADTQGTVDSAAGDPLVLSTEAATRYTAIEFLGKGAMGEVFRARDTLLHRDVALKFVTSESAVSQLRLVREARVAARINHPNAVAVHDVGVIDGQLFIAMELVEGPAMSAWLAAGQSSKDILAAFLQAGRALEAAHAAGVLHRDFKPHNVLMSLDGRARVGDFGLARFIGDDEDTHVAGPRVAQGSDLTTTGAVMGTPAYMSPEQQRGGPFDARADQFSFAVALYEALTGRHPYVDDEPGLAGPWVLRRFPSRFDDVPERVFEVVVRGLAIEPVDRWPSMSELLGALERAMVPAAPSTPTAAEGPGRSLRRRRATWIAIGAGVAGVAGATALTLWATSDRSSRATAAVKAEHDDGARADITLVERLTSDPGCEEYPVFSRDGRTVYYSGDVDGDSEIFAIDTATRERRRLSREPGRDSAVRVSPDGRRLAWAHGRSGEKQLRTLRLDEPGSVPVAAGALVYPRIEWASDSTIVAVREDNLLEKIEIDAEGRSATRQLRGRGPDLFGILAMRVLDGGDWLLATEYEGATRLFVGPLSGPWQPRLLRDWNLIADSGLAARSDRDGVYFVGRLAQDNRALLRWSKRSTRVDALPVPTPGYGVDVRVDGTALVYSTCRMRSWIARVDAPDREPIQVLSSTRWAAQTPVPLPGERMLVTSDRDGGTAIWSYDLRTGDGRSISPPTAFMPAASSDSRFVAYIDHPDVRHGGLVIVELATMSTRQLTADSTDRSPMFGHDDRSVYVLRHDGGLRVFRVDFDDASAVPITGPGVVAFAVSPVDDEIAYVMAGTPDRQMFLQRAGEQPRRIPQLPGGNYDAPSFSADGTKLLVVRGLTELLEVTLDGATPPKVLYSLRRSSGAYLGAPRYRPDGAGVFVSISASEGDLQLVRGVFP